jgi:hypothetical protein
MGFRPDKQSSDAELIMDIEGEFQPRLDILPPPQR